jgi:hypothetical protein
MMQSPEPLPTPARQRQMLKPVLDYAQSRRGWTIRTWAIMVGVPRHYIDDILAGRGTDNVRMWNKLAAVCQKPRSRCTVRGRVVRRRTPAGPIACG